MPDLVGLRTRKDACECCGSTSWNWRVLGIADNPYCDECEREHFVQKVDALMDRGILIIASSRSIPRWNLIAHARLLWRLRSHYQEVNHLYDKIEELESSNV